MGSPSWNILRQVALLVLLSIVVNGGNDLYSNVYISPNSADYAKKEEEIESADKTLAPSDISIESIQPSYSPPESEYLSSEAVHFSSFSNHDRVQRSASPILSRTSGLDNLGAYKNVGENLDSNDVELSGRMMELLQPSKTEKDDLIAQIHPTFYLQSGELQRAPQGRSLLEPQDLPINPSATTTERSSATSSLLQPKGRQANADIQDIITGIVKLLNGNVNVQANTAPDMGRPLRPLSTRINNRGPPRITDVPALPPDFDVPAPPLPPPPLGQMAPPPNRLPTPYPFDVPPPNVSPLRPFSNTPLDQNKLNKRPGLYRPITIPPWNSRPPNRRPTNRRPTPIPAYKPISPDLISLTSERPQDDIFNLDLGSQLQSSSEEIKNNGTDAHTSETTINSMLDTSEVTTNVAVESSEEVDKETLEFEKNKEKSFSKKVKTTSVTPTVHQEQTSTSLTLDLISLSNTEKDSTTTESIDNSVSLNATSILPTEVIPTLLSSTIVDIVHLNDSIAEEKSNSSDSIPILESSVQDILHSIKNDMLTTSSSMIKTPTQGLLTTTAIGPSNVPTSNATTSNQSSAGFPYFPYRPRPGIVLDDTEYKPGGGNYRQPSIITRPPLQQIGDIFDVTVSAIQGPNSHSSSQGKPYVIPVDIEGVHVGQDVITSAAGDNGFVSIDGKRTYLNLFGETQAPSTTAAAVIKPTAPTHNHITATGFATVETEKKPVVPVKPTPRRPLYPRPKPSQPPVRIDTCIVGDDSTCDVSQHEICRTEAGVSACHCRPGHARRKHRDPCRKIVSVLLSLRVDKLYERRVVWSTSLADKNSDSYQQLSFEAERALESAMSMTPFSDEFLGANVNGIYSGQRSAGQAGVFVNLTLKLEENVDTSRPNVRADIQKHLLGVIQRRSNNVGNSALWVDSPPGSISNLQDLDECSSPDLHDCHSLAKCTNIFGGFKCECLEGYRDQWADSKHRAGRHCEQCSPQHCNNRGECKYKNGQETCVCSGNYYGTQCELDGEVLGVAIGASVAAVIIIGLTLVCLVMWSRRWSREQKAAVGSPVFGYMATASNTVKAPVVGNPPYQLTLEDRLRWAQIADVMAQANHYAPEPVNAPTRPASTMFGYPTLGTLPHGSIHGTLPPVPLPRLNLQAQLAGRAASMSGMRPLDNSSSSEEEDKADLLGRNFQVPRPKSRSNASIANQSGIYYDVDYDQHDPYKQPGGIPMSTYSMGRPGFYR